MCESQVPVVVNLMSPGLVKEFTEPESWRRQRFIRMPVRGDGMVSSCAK
jgi:hypothetical protein